MLPVAVMTFRIVIQFLSLIIKVMKCSLFYQEMTAFLISLTKDFLQLSQFLCYKLINFTV